MILTVMYLSQVLIEKIWCVRKKNIHHFCQAYFSSNEEILSRYMPKHKLVTVLQYMNEHSLTLSNLYSSCQDSNNLPELVRFYFSKVKSDEIYIIILLEYSILAYTSYENASISNFTENISYLLAKYSKFFPTTNRKLRAIFQLFK